MTARLVLATHNAHKLGELRDILCGPSGVRGLAPEQIVSAADLQAPTPVEDGVTFAANALIKARSLAGFAGLPVIADDSGLAVEVLGGAPGIFSARWCGEHGDDASNLTLLLGQLADVPDEHRGAQFVCAAVLVGPDGSEVVEHGEMPGTLLRAPRGTGGFGYDPILVPQGETRSAAELTAVEKHRISHRGKAFRALVPAIARVLTAGAES